jgi:hypothetical protein
VLALERQHAQQVRQLEDALDLFGAWDERELAAVPLAQLFGDDDDVQPGCVDEGEPSEVEHDGAGPLAAEHEQLSVQVRGRGEVELPCESQRVPASAHSVLDLERTVPAPCA